MHLDLFHDYDGHPTDLDPTAVVYTYDYACNWWVGPSGQIITQEEMTARMSSTRAPRMVDRTREVTHG